MCRLEFPFPIETLESGLRIYFQQVWQHKTNLDSKSLGLKGHGIQRPRGSNATGHLAVWARSHVFLFHLHHGMWLFPFSDNLFSFFSQKKFKMPPHPIHRWTPQSNADFHHCRQAYHILSNHICNLILSYLILSYHTVSIHSKQCVSLVSGLGK